MIVIGDNTVIASYAKLITECHATNSSSFLAYFKPIIDHVWICSDATVLACVLAKIIKYRDSHSMYQKLFYEILQNILFRFYNATLF